MPCRYGNGFDKSDTRKLRYITYLLLAVIPLTHGLDLPTLIYGADKSAEPIIIDDNGGQPIFIDSSDDEMGSDDDDSG